MKISKQYSGEELLDVMKAKLDEITTSTSTANITADIDVTDEYLDALYDSISDELYDEVDIETYKAIDDSIFFRYTWMDMPFESECPISDLTGDVESDAAYIANGILHDLDNYEE